MDAAQTRDEPHPLSLLLFSCSVVSYCFRPHQASLSFTISWSLLKLMSIESVMPSNHLILCAHLLLLPSVFPSIRIFSSESVPCIRWPKNWSFSISLSNEYSELISFKIDWFDLLAVQGTLKGLLLHHSSKAVLWHATFFIVQLTSVHDYWKKQSLDYMDLCRQVMSLLFILYFIYLFIYFLSPLVNMLSRFVIVFLPRGKCLLVSWLQSLSTVILEPKVLSNHCCFKLLDFGVAG